MKVKGPLVTLAAGATLAAGLLIADISLSSKQASDTVSVVPAGGGSAVATFTSPAASPATAPPTSPAAATTAPAAAADPVTYAGHVTGGGSLALVVRGGSAIAYFCDGHAEAWLWGTAQGSTLTLRNSFGDTLTGTRGGGRVTGSLTVGHRTRAFTLATVRKPSGLFRATATVRGAKVVAGWVVLPDGSQVGAWTSDGGVPTPAPPLDPATGAVTVDGAAMTAAVPDPAATP